MLTSLSPHLPLALDLTQHTRWTATQENALQTYPFADSFEGVDEHEHGHGHEQEEKDQEQAIHHAVVRVYLQFLWLPESIMPLSLFIPAIASASTAATLSWSPSPASLHPLHTLLEPLIMAPRAATNKYHTDLLQILADGGGAGEIEENMMWFALSFEKYEGIAGQGQESEAEERSEPWRDEEWRKVWLERMERREVQIQILLHFLKLSLPGPEPPHAADVPSSSSSAIRSRQHSYLPAKWNRQRKPAKAPSLSTSDALEVYMDKMSTWQLMQGLERIHPDHALTTKTISGKESSSTGTGKADDERDWIQIFAEDVVEKQFRSYLPDLCDLFHEKVFPTSAISDTNDFDNDVVIPAGSPSSTRSNSPTEGEPSYVPSRSMSTSSSNSLVRKSEAGTVGMANANRLSRSRSLSVSLQQERESQRDATSQQKRKKRALNREVSMLRVFKAKYKAPMPSSDNAGLVFDPPTDLLEVKDRNKRQRHPIAKDKGKAKAARDESEITLVEATPSINRTNSFSGTFVPRMVLAPGSESGNADMDVDLWESELPKSRDVIMGAAGGTEEEEDAILVVETPTKVKRRSRVTKMAGGG